MDHLAVLRGSKRVLDIGCRTKDFFKELQRTYSIEEIVGVDLVPSEGVVCIDLLADNVDHLGKFDAVISHDCFVSFKPHEKIEMLKKAKSMLNPGGYIIINDFTRSIFLANFLANLFRKAWGRALRFAWLALIYGVTRRKEWRFYYFVGRSFYEGIDIGMPVKYFEHEGYFNRTAAADWFQAKADRLIPCRNLVVLGPL